MEPNISPEQAQQQAMELQAERQKNAAHNALFFWERWNNRQEKRFRKGRQDGELWEVLGFVFLLIAPSTNPRRRQHKRVAV